MFHKLLLILAILGATAVALLVNRQHRIVAAHEAAVLHQELAAQRQDLWQLRRAIAQESQPGRVRRAMTELGGTWSPSQLTAVSDQLIDKDDGHDAR